jgi:transposase-like protein
MASETIRKGVSFVFMDAIHYNVRDSRAVVKKTVYIVLAHTMDRLKDVLGIYVGESESSKYWLMVLNDLKK